MNNLQAGLIAAVTQHPSYSEPALQRNARSWKDWLDSEETTVESLPAPSFEFPTATGSIIEADWHGSRSPWARDDDGEWIALNTSLDSVNQENLKNPVLKFDAGAEG